MDRTNVLLDQNAVQCDITVLRDALKAGVLPPALRGGGGELVNDLLYGFEALGDRFADWLADTKRQITASYLDRMEKAANRTDLSPQLRIDMAEAALALDPLGENVCRFAMSLANDLGDIGRALQIYSAFYARMEAELDMEPSLATQDLAASIKLGTTNELDKTTPASTPAHNPAVSLPNEPAALRNHGRPIMAVLPLQVVGTQPLQTHLTDMLVDNVIMKITRQREISVISQVSIRHLTDRPDVVAVLSENFNVRYVLSGTIRITDLGYHLNMAFTRTDDGVLLWAHSLEVTEDALFQANSDTAEQVVHMLMPHLQRSEIQGMGSNTIENLSAYQKLLKAQELVYTLSKPLVEMAGGMLQDAVATWPDYVPARVALADWYSLWVGQGWSQDPQADMRAIQSMLQNVVTNDARSGRALAMLGHNLAIYARRYDEALSLFEDALRATPGDAETLLWTGPTLAYTDQEGEAIERLLQASRLTLDNPLRFRYEHFLSLAYFAAGNMSEAARIGVSSLMRNSRYTSSLRVTTGACVAIGDMEKSRELGARILLLEPDFRVSEFIKRQGFRDPARRADFGDLLRRAGLPN
ncbi:BTAD domain-containing putative transcriptional regulator [Yoonia sp. GPGPB17]|uniref:BTAD domain-containing putative transcriptional regulator n=1 Tax=Yoonia sp. GPGPB17 TaxID=3026147 RepID=UPI0030C059FB